jgi:hypothetical protein
MHKITKDPDVKSLYEVSSGEFFEVLSDQRLLDEKCFSFHTGDVFLKTNSHDYVFISSNHPEGGSWVGNEFDLNNEDGFDNIEVRVFTPKTIIFQL